ncbi:MAG: hypothetical protein QOD39_1847, partial [Mycobacterium sp.]|nr:hypothetical protein [Mycobacterium sp.]
LVFKRLAYMRRKMKRLRGLASPYPRHGALPLGAEGHLHGCRCGPSGGRRQLRELSGRQGAFSAHRASVGKCYCRKAGGAYARTDGGVTTSLANISNHLNRPPQGRPCDAIARYPA